MATPHPRLHALLDLVGGAEMRTSPDDYVRFVLPGTEPTGVYLDHITAPGDSTDARTS